MKTLIILSALSFNTERVPLSTANFFTVSAGVANSYSILPRKPIRSSDIASVGYDDANQILEVEFRTGPVYQYYNVPKSVYEGLMHAPSHGTYLARYIKGVYRYREVN
jgi:hypothetical protein